MVSVNQKVPMKLPKISIVTPSFNQGVYLEECIRSIISQGYPNLEYIVLDGGSSDESVEIIKRYEKHLTYWQSEPDGGQYSAVQFGFSRATGEILAWLNSDDKYPPYSLFRVAYLFCARPDVDWLTGRSVVWDKSGKLEWVAPKSDFRFFNRKAYFSQVFESGAPITFIQQESTFWRRSLWAEAGACFRSDLEYAADLELWARFFRIARLFPVNSIIGGFRSHGENKSIVVRDAYMDEARRVIQNERSMLHANPGNDTPPLIEQPQDEFEQFLIKSCPEMTSDEVWRLVQASSLADNLVNFYDYIRYQFIVEIEKVRNQAT
jgi:glycosyltransferase involved in cell wall biosynthesis